MRGGIGSCLLSRMVLNEAYQKGKFMQKKGLKNSQLRIGVIGVSGRGVMVKSMHRPEGEAVVVAGADIYQEFAPKFHEFYGDDAFFTTDYRRLLERDDIDAVVVTSPDPYHAEHAIAALEAGKHVYCEKPLAITVADCDRILKAYLDSGKHLMMGFNMRYMNIFRTMKDIVDAGTIGEIKAVWVRHFVGSGGKWYYHDWHANRRKSTSLLLQKASHDFDMIHWITGRWTSKVAAFGSLDFFGGDKPDTLECPDCPEKHECPEYQEWPHHQFCCFRKEVDVEDNSVVIMELEHGLKATYTQCHFTPDYWRNYVFIGTEGRMENLDDSTSVIVKTRRSSKWKNLSDRTYTVKKAEGGHGGSDTSITQGFIDLLLTGKQPVSSPLAGRMSVAVGCAAAESMRAGGQLVQIPALPQALRRLPR